jgi:extradiol dioxygenase
VISALSYIGFASPNSAQWRTFGPEVLGVQVAEPGPDGAVRLRVDDAEARIVIHPGEREQLAYFGWDVGDASGLAAAGERVGQVGITVRHDSDLAAVRRTAEVAWFVDPFGFRHELSYGLASGGPFAPGRPISGFVTGDGGLGHVVLLVPDLARAAQFYGDVLGFKLSDTIDHGTSIRFFHCNPRHHTLAIAAARGMVGVHHLMLEVGSIDDVGAALDIVNERHIPLAMSLGRHTNDHMTSFYVRTPSGFEIEYGTGGVRIDDRTWTVAAYDAQSTWGHKQPASGRLVPQILAPFDPAPAAAPAGPSR